MPSLALKIPPVIQLVITLILAYLLAKFYHGPVWPLAIAALPLTVAALFFMLGGVIACRRAQTTVDPRDPSKAQCLVRRGVFKYSRNPMYLGMLLLQTAFCCYLHEIHAFVTVPLLWFSLRELQIKSEEQSLKGVIWRKLPAILPTSTALALINSDSLRQIAAVCQSKLCAESLAIYYRAL